MHIICPHCQNPIELIDAPASEDIVRPSCGSTFRLQQGTTILWKEPDGKGRLWTVPQPLQAFEERIDLWLQATTGRELDEDGAMRGLDNTTWQKRRQLLEKVGGAPHQL